MEKKSKMGEWPLSNYPIFFALILLATTAVTLSMGDEKRAEGLAIYAYYLLVIGVSIRFFELALPENTVYRLGLLKVRIFELVRKYELRIRVLFQNFAIKRRISNIKIPHLHSIKLSKHLETMADIFGNVAIFLSLFLFVSLIYGLMIDWWAVEGYLSNLVLAILIFFTLYFFSRLGSSR